MILGFKSAFVQSVIAGTKPHSIRSGNRWRVGMSIQFYQNVRQKSMTKIRPDAVVKVVQSITIKPAPEQFLGPHLGPPTQPSITIDGRQLTPLECAELARRDGFEDFALLLRFFRANHGLPFTGQLIGWTDLRY